SWRAGASATVRPRWPRCAARRPPSSARRTAPRTPAPSSTATTWSSSAATEICPVRGVLHSRNPKSGAAPTLAPRGAASRRHGRSATARAGRRARGVAAAATGREVLPLQPVLTNFAPQGGPHDVLLCGGPYELLTFRPLGDGSYQHNGGFFFATGGVGLALTAGAMIARGVGNRSRREAAAQAAVPR